MPDGSVGDAHLPAVMLPPKSEVKLTEGLDRNLMAKDDFKNLGFKDLAGSTDPKASQ